MFKIRTNKFLKQLTVKMLELPCLICGQTTGQHNALCPGCEEELPWQPPGCQRCGVWDQDSPATTWTCAECLKHPPGFDRCICLFRYENPIDILIHNIKDRAGFAEAKTLSLMLAQEFNRYYQEHCEPLPTLLAPVPLHTRRLRQRGYNQAALLAATIHKQSAIPLLHHSCTHRRLPQNQRGSDAATRRANSATMFTNNRHSRLTRHQHIAIIDDVVTTGSTASGMAHVLRNAGAAAVDVWALARVN